MLRRRRILNSLLSRFSIGAIMGLMLFSACSPTGRTNQGSVANKLQLEDCQLAAPGVPVRLDARCGKFSVPEDPNDPQGKQINLRLAVLPAVSRNPAPDPIFFIPGGPCEAATESYLGLSGAFEVLNQKRDIVLVDQRDIDGSGAHKALGNVQPGESSADDHDMRHGLPRVALRAGLITEPSA